MDPRDAGSSRASASSDILGHLRLGRPRLLFLVSFPRMPAIPVCRARVVGHEGDLRDIIRSVRQVNVCPSKTSASSRTRKGERVVSQVSEQGTFFSGIDSGLLDARRRTLFLSLFGNRHLAYLALSSFRGFGYIVRSFAGDCGPYWSPGCTCPPLRLDTRVIAGDEPPMWN